MDSGLQFLITHVVQFQISAGFRILKVLLRLANLRIPDLLKAEIERDDERSHTLIFHFIYVFPRKKQREKKRDKKREEAILNTLHIYMYIKI